MTTDTPHFIDALPYIDTAIDDDEEQRNIAMKEVDDEIDMFPPEKDYLEYMPAIESRAFSTPLIEYEHSCIENNEPRPPSFELSQIRTEIPPTAHSMMDDEELTIWTRCLNQVKIKLEYKQRQMINLELIKSYGTLAWEQFIAENQAISAALQEGLDELNKQTQEVNWNRKSEQERVSKTLEVLKNEWNAYMDKNRILSEEIKKISQQIQSS